MSSIDDVYYSEDKEVDFPDIEKLMGSKLENTVKAYNLLSTISSGGSFASIIDSVPTKDLESWFRKKKSESAAKDVKEATEKKNEEIEKHNEETGDDLPTLDPEKSEKKVDNILKTEAKAAAEKSNDDLAVHFKALKNSLKVKSDSFTESIKTLASSVPTQIATIMANPYTANTIPAIALQFLTAISSLLTIASSVVEAAMELYIPLPESFTKSIETACSIRSAMSSLLGIVDSFDGSGDNILSEINKKSEEAINSRREKKAMKDWIKSTGKTEDDWKNLLTESERKAIIDKWVEENEDDDIY